MYISIQQDTRAPDRCDCMCNVLNNVQVLAQTNCFSINFVLPVYVFFTLKALSAFDLYCMNRQGQFQLKKIL